MTKLSIIHTSDINLPYNGNDVWPSPIMNKNGRCYTTRTILDYRSTPSKKEGCDHIETSYKKKKLNGLPPMPFKDDKKIPKQYITPRMKTRTPSTHRIKGPSLYEFDIYIAAAALIQKHYRGYKSRARYCDINKWRKACLFIQKQYRKHKDKQAVKISVHSLLKNSLKQMNNIISSITNQISEYNKCLAIINTNCPAMRQQEMKDKHTARIAELLSSFKTSREDKSPQLNRSRVISQSDSKTTVSRFSYKDKENRVNVDPKDSEIASLKDEVTQLKSKISKITKIHEESLTVNPLSEIHHGNEVY